MKSKMLPILILIVSLIIISEISAQNSGNSDFKPSGNLWGYVFGDYYVKAHSDSAGRGGKNVQYSPAMTGTPGVNGTAGSTGANAFQIRRAYLGYDYNITSKVSASVLLANEQNLDANGYNTTYLKYMYIQWLNIFQNSNLFIGQMPTPAYSMRPFGTSSLWGYRSIERTIMDMHNLDASTDLGMGLQGNLWQKGEINDTAQTDLVGYEIMVGNNNSARPAANIFKRFRGTLYASFLQQKLTFGVYGDYFRTGLATMNGTVQIPVQESKTFKAYVDYKTRTFRIGAEAFEQENANSDEYFVKNSEGISNNVFVSGLQQGVSVFLSGKILPNLNFYARFDMYNPDKKFNNTYQLNYITTEFGSVKTTTIGSVTSSGSVITTTTQESTLIKTNTSTYNQTFALAGLDYTITKRIHVMPNIWYNQYKSKLDNVSSKIRSDYDLVPRITLYIIFNKLKYVDDNGMDH